MPRNECPGDSGAYRHECPGGHFAGGTTMPTQPGLKYDSAKPLSGLFFSYIPNFVLICCLRAERYATKFWTGTLKNEKQQMC